MTMTNRIRPKVRTIALQIAKDSQKYCANPINPDSEQFQFIVHELSETLIELIMGEVLDEVQYHADWSTADYVKERVEKELEKR